MNAFEIEGLYFKLDCLTEDRLWRATVKFEDCAPATKAGFDSSSAALGWIESLFVDEIAN